MEIALDSEIEKARYAGNIVNLYVTRRKNRIPTMANILSKYDNVRL